MKVNALLDDCPGCRKLNMHMKIILGIMLSLIIAVDAFAGFAAKVEI